MRLRFRLFLFCCLVAIAACNQAPTPVAAIPTSTVALEFAGSAACKDCHQAQFSDWAGSHHDQAMQVADADTVLANFSASVFEYYETKTRFRESDDGFFVTTDNADGVQQEYKVVYVFGVEPLQQYLVEFPGGRLQALPFAWDTRSEALGGQRWFHLYPDEFIGPGDELHWTGRSQNWNYMCAECHSTKLEMNYDIATNSFATSYEEINVGCEACHGRGSVHVQQAENSALSHDFGLEVNLDDQGRATWQMNPATGIAERTELAMRPPQQPESCGRCHSRRGLISSDYEYGKPLADTHLPSLLAESLYFADGQIQDEVYVYGSFLQSRMYLAGVTCSDCHNPHSLKLVTGDDPSAVCTQCHMPAKFSSSEHSRHVMGQVACVDCHMPSRIYMGVDGRRDHSFRVPRPDLTLTTGSPNACNGCHTDRDAGWAASIVTDWTGSSVPARVSFATALYAGRSRFANPELLDVINDSEQPGIARATALSLLAAPVSQADAETIQRSSQSADPLVRIGALRAMQLLPGELLLQLGPGLLDDPVRGVRIEAASLLRSVQDQLPPAQQSVFLSAANEYRAAQLAIANLPEAHSNLGGFEASSGNFSEALNYFQQSLKMEPRSAVTRVNMADVFRRLGEETLAEQRLRDGLEYTPDSPVLRHSLGLLLVRTDQLDAGIQELREAARLAPEYSRYIYVVGVALNSIGQQEEAVQVLDDARIRFPTDFDIAWALATILRDKGEIDRATVIAVDLASRHPDDRNVAALLASLRAP
jgi:tetratricopeptide (TPR) repeat protein